MSAFRDGREVEKDRLFPGLKELGQSGFENRKMRRFDGFGHHEDSHVFLGFQFQFHAVIGLTL